MFSSCRVPHNVLELRITFALLYATCETCAFQVQDFTPSARAVEASFVQIAFQSPAQILFQD